MLTMMMSIAHRITGVALYIGTLLLAWYLDRGRLGPQRLRDRGRLPELDPGLAC